LHGKAAAAQDIAVPGTLSSSTDAIALTAARNLGVKVPVVVSTVQRPTARLPFPASRTTLLSSRPAGTPAAWL